MMQQLHHCTVAGMGDGWNGAEDLELHTAKYIQRRADNNTKRVLSIKCMC
jgi:hypothetical protein